MTEQSQTKDDVGAKPKSPEHKAARDRVDAMVINPLVEAGMTFGARVRKPERDEYLRQLRVRLAYLEPDNLVALASSIERNGHGPQRNLWPALASVSAWAHMLQHEPDDQIPIIGRFMKSQGQRMFERGPEYAVALLEFLRARRRPPEQRTWDEINDKAAAYAARVDRIRAGDLTYEGDPGFLRWFEAMVGQAAQLSGANKQGSPA